ncbi:hypothetical protein B0H11DRAFT_1927761 [Mycena galericulata]|nr:hypothetical protein B0H11DRAFT_1927761 [Mycena galericulata]
MIAFLCLSSAYFSKFFGRRQARRAFSGLDRNTQFTDIFEAVTALMRREAAPITPRRRIAFPRAAYPGPSSYTQYLRIHMPGTHNLRPFLRTAKTPKRRIDFPRTASQAAGGHIKLPSESTRHKPGIQNSIFGCCHAFKSFKFQNSIYALYHNFDKDSFTTNTQ